MTDIAAITADSATIPSESLDSLATAASHLRSDPFPAITPLSLLVEFAVILAALFLFANTYRNFDPNLRPNGGDWMVLNASGGYSNQIFQRYGAIPLWNPFLGQGEPLIEAPTSYVLNPFMFLPVLLGGAVTGGKIAIVLHLLIMAFGAWLLGRLLYLHAPGRVLLALLFAGAGGFAAAVGEGHFQIGLSQAYIPWILAGLIGTLHLRRRGPIALFIVAWLLMIFSGSWLYVLTTAVSCIIVAIFGIVQWLPAAKSGKRFVINGKGLSRLFGAVILILIIGAIRILPQLQAEQYTYSPPDRLNDLYSLPEVLEVFFAPTAGVAGLGYWVRYSYVFPGIFVALLIVAVIMLRIPNVASATRRRQTTNFLIASAVIIALFTFWAIGATAPTLALYNIFPFLDRGQPLGRYGAAAAYFIAILVALLFDAATTYVFSIARTRNALKLRLLPFGLPTVAAQGLLIALVLMAGFGSFDVLNNWDRVGGLVKVDPYDNRYRGVTAIRNAYPSQFASIDTLDVANSMEFFDTLSRTTVGNPNAFMGGVQGTIGFERFTGVSAEFAAGYNYGFLVSRESIGYVPVPGAPQDGVAIAWQDPDTPAYAFVIDRTLLDKAEPFHRADTQDVTYYDAIDSITVQTANYPPGAILIVSEMQFPGWTATLNGNPAPLESAQGRLALILPDTVEPITAVFTYHPTILYFSAVISLIGLVLYLLFTFRIDRRLRRRIFGINVNTNGLTGLWKLITRLAKTEV
ncbi:MAG: hypothetical protein U0528_17415 [Anaerolineae bacterium]